MQESVQIMEVGRWNIRFIKKSRIIPSEVLEELEEFTNTVWLKTVLDNFQKSKKWWSMAQFGVPSPIIRVDMAPFRGHSPVSTLIYEVELRPAGMGVMLSLLSEERREVWREVFQVFNCRGFIRISDSPIQDDAFAAMALRFPYREYQGDESPEGPGPYWIRCENPRHDLDLISLVPTQGDEDKKHLVDLGLARIFRPEEIDWDSSFVVKPLVGSKMRGVEIYLPPDISKALGNPKGISTRSRVMKAVSGEPYVIQSFIPPVQEEINGQIGWAIWRLFFGWQNEKYSFLAGFWNWRPNLRIHGASDTIFCPLVLSRGGV